MKKFLLLSIAIICIGRAKANMPDKLKIVIPQCWSGDAQRFLNPSLYDISTSDTLNAKINVYSPDGVHLSTIFCTSFPGTHFLEEAINSSRNIWVRLKRIPAYSSLVKYKL